jgi:hypothetical protein
MQGIELFLLFTERLESAGLGYMVGGSVGSMCYGEPRLTNDIDIVVDLRIPQVQAMAAAFPLEAFYCPPDEVMRIESQRSGRGHFNLIHHDSGYKADIYLCGQDPLQAWGMARRRRIDLPGGALWVAPPEYIILRKLEFYQEGGSEKHRLDIQGMLTMLGSAIDAEAINNWAERLGVASVWAPLIQGCSST